MRAPDDLICSVLRGESPNWPRKIDDDTFADALRRQAAVHGVQALLHAHLVSAAWPAAVLQALRHAAIGHAVWELRHQQLLARTLGELHGAGIEPVLIKGTPLAYSLYSSPLLRTRGDTDLVIAHNERQRVHDTLLALGYQRNTGVSGDFVSYQASYTSEADGGAHTLDLHWKINNSQLLSQLFSYDELRTAAEPLPALCPHALGASRVHALLLACMHRATHRQNPYYVDGVALYEGNRLIWLYDLHLLGNQLSEAQWQEFCVLAERKGLQAVSLDGMQQATLAFHTRYPDFVIAALARPGPAEPAADYLNGGKLRQQWMDFCALGTASRRLHFLRELVFPPPEYMRAKYGRRASGWLPWLYLRRAAGGLRKAVQ